MIVMEEGTVRITRDQEVGITVIVIIADGHADTVERNVIDTRPGCNLLEFAVSEVAVKRISHRSGTLATRRFSTVHQENVQQAVLIKIEERSPAILRFDQVSIGRLSVEVLPGNAARLGYVGENATRNLRTRGGAAKRSHQQACHNNRREPKNGWLFQDLPLHPSPQSSPPTSKGVAGAASSLAFRF